MSTIFRYDLATWNGPRLILITDAVGKRSELPLLGVVVLPRRVPYAPIPKRLRFTTKRGLKP